VFAPFYCRPLNRIEDEVDLFLIKTALSFIVGGIWIAAATLAAEHFGTKLGGFLGGLPSTAAVALFFIAWTDGRPAAYQATTVFPLAFSVNALFFLAYVLSAKHSAWLGLAAAIVTWFSAQAVIAYATPTSFGLALVVWALILTAATWLLMGPLHVPASGSVRLNHPGWQIVGRATFGGFMVGVAVALSRYGGPVLGGIFSTFPAVNISTLIITSRTAGTAFSKAIVTPLLISSEVNCVAFAGAFRFAIVALDPLPALAIAYVAAMVTGVGTYYFIHARLH
jgi:hypothetical protein